jgi:hypothetical protein
MMTPKTSNRGGALLISVVVLLLMSGMAGAFFSLSMIHSRRTADVVNGLQSLYAAEAATALVIHEMNQGLSVSLHGVYSGADFTVKKIEYGKDGKDNDGNGKIDDAYESLFMELEATGNRSGSVRGIRVLLSRSGGGVWWNALYAGNRSGDRTYSLLLGGQAGQADYVRGSVYSGGDVHKSGDAAVERYPGQDAGDLQIMAAGSVVDQSSQRNLPPTLQGFQPDLDLAIMEYEKNHGVHVKNELETKGRSGGDEAGGSAVQITDPDEPAHIFRMNPSDRGELTSATTKNDYFLEDPTQPVRLDPNWNGTDAYHLRLTTAKGNNLVYYVDGNLWLNNRHTYSFKFYHPEPTGVKVTFVAKGNIYFGDNLFYTNVNKDAVAFIAMKDPAVPDSGNIYFGDPLYGTTKRFEGYMYAENNFYDNNIGTPSSMTTTVFGNMTAGNQVQIRRDKPDGTHVKLQVDFDPKAREGNGPPGLPPNLGGGTGKWQVVTWKQIP